VLLTWKKWARKWLKHVWKNWRNKHCKLNLLRILDFIMLVYYLKTLNI
jgi:hypothetical protein